MFLKVCLGWKLSPMIIRQRGWNKNVLDVYWMEKIQKLINTGWGE